MKKITTVFAVLLSIVTMYGQDGSIKGKVTTIGNLPIQNVNIIVKNTNKGMTTNVLGEYEIKNLKSGSYKLEVSYIGYETQEEAIEISENEVQTIDFIILQSSTELQEVEVIGQNNPYRTKETTVGTKSATPIIDIPQSISFVTSELMQDQRAFRITDIVRNISGVNQESSSGDFRIRGFNTSRVVVINGLKISKGWTPRLISNLERVEVIKGPNSALFGNSDPGGTINRVTKKPLDVRGVAFNMSLGSWNTMRVELDLTGPLNKEKTLLYRLNVAHQNAGSFRDLQDNRDLLIAPSISFVPNDKTRIDIDIIYNNFDGKVDRGQPFLGDAAAEGEAKLTSTPISLSATLSNSYLKEEDLIFMASIKHKFTDNISFNASMINSNNLFDRVEHRTGNSYGVDSLGNEQPTQMLGRLIVGKRHTRDFNLMSYFNIDFDMGAVKHQVVVGYDYVNSYVPVGELSIRLAGAYRNATNTGAIKKYDPSKPEDYLFDENGNPVPNMPHFDLVNPNYNPQDYRDYFTELRNRDLWVYSNHGIYIQDQIKLGKLQVLLGLRQEFITHIDDYRGDNENTINYTPLIPRVGLVYSMTKNINIYGTYVEGFQPQETDDLGDPAVFGGPFDPLTSNLIELGTKTEWFNKKLFFTVAAYQIEQNNILIDAGDPDNPDLLKQIGQEVSKGVEFDINGNILPNLSISANYAYNEIIITEDDDPELIGRQLRNAPHHMGGFWIKYDLNEGFMKGLSVAGGNTFVSKQRTGAGFNLPSYSTLDAAVYYQYEKVRVSFNFNNLTNETYWIGRGRAGRGIAANPGAPRNFMFSVGYSF